jgi:hypothetical protein
MQREHRMRDTLNMPRPSELQHSTYTVFDGPHILA